MAEENINLLDPDDDHEKDRGEGKRPASTDSLPELPAPAQGNHENEPARTPISIEDLEPERAKDILRAPIGLGASVFPEIDAGEIGMLVGQTIDSTASRARQNRIEGMSIAELAELAGIRRSAIDERFDVWLPRMANLVARAVNAQAGRQVFYEQLDSHPARAGRRHNGVGTERVPGIPRNQLHMLAYSLGSSDRHCPAASEVLTTASRWDRSSPRFGESFPAWVADYEGNIPSSLAEHLERLLGEDRSVRRAFQQGARNAAFAGALTPKRMIAAFSRFLVVPPIPCGTSFVEHRSHGEILLPGRDEEVVEVATASGRRAVLACGEASMQERLAFEEDAKELLVGKLPSMYELDIHKQHSVEYRWSPSRHELGRYEAGAGSRLEIWRLVGYDDDESFWRMLSLIERHTQVSWTYSCTLRWELDCMPGMQKAHLPENCAGVRALLTMANAGIADALRRLGRGETR